MSKYRIREDQNGFTIEKYTTIPEVIPTKTFLGITIKSKEIEIHKWSDRFSLAIFLGTYTYREIEKAQKKIDLLIEQEEKQKQPTIYHYYPKENNS